MTFEHRSLFPRILSLVASFFPRELGLPQCNGASSGARHCDRTWHRSAGTDFGFRPSTLPAVLEAVETTNMQIWELSRQMIRLVIAQAGNTMGCTWTGWTGLLEAGVEVGKGRFKSQHRCYCRGSLQGLRAPGETHGWTTIPKGIEAHPFPTNTPRKISGHGGKLYEFLSVSGCSESWTNGTIVTSFNEVSTMTGWNER